MGIRVEKNNDLAPALSEALASKRPAVVDVVTTKEGRMFEKLYSRVARKAHRGLVTSKV